MRAFPESATKTVPLPSTATPHGKLNCPSPLPTLPHFVKNVPLLSNFSMRALTTSVTNTLPLASTAMPDGLLNCPFPLPKLPHLVTNGHEGDCSQWHAHESSSKV